MLAQHDVCQSRNINTALEDGANFNPLRDCYPVLLREALRLSFKDPSLPSFLYRTVRAQRHAFRARQSHAARGLTVPPVMVFSVTNRCNLHCKGCYHHALRDVTEPEMSDQQLFSAVKEGRDLGVSLMVFVGGEPLLRPDIMSIISGFPDVIFLLFTNGTLITTEMARRFRAHRNVVPVLSLEGYAPETDARRGKGTSEALHTAVRRLRSEGVFFGTSITVTSENFNTVVNESFVHDLTVRGCRFILFSEYTPSEPGTQGWVISEVQRDVLAEAVRMFRGSMPALFFSAPGDERRFGGCLSAGRGFIHINARGDVEPCPFVPYSDANLENVSLREALGSSFLKAIRVSGVEEGSGGCALWNKRDWLRSLLPPEPEAEVALLEPFCPSPVS